MKARILGAVGLMAASAIAPIDLIAAGSPTQTSAALDPQTVSDQDISRFWQAFDAINATADPTERLRLIQTLYIDP